MVASNQDAYKKLQTALADRYQIEDEIGRGGMATVYLAEDLKHRRKVAVKVLDPEISAVVGTDRFLAEIETTANLQHPHILPLFDSGEADGLLFYVMPFVEGESLRDRLDRETQLPVEDALRIAREVADGLTYAHGLGVVHRDIKPENVLLSGGHALIADFGIARAVTVAGGTRLTETGLSLGTPHYMSPEQATGEMEVDARSDLYSLGCVIYEMLAGEPPHTGPNAQAIISKVLTQQAPRLRETRDTVPPGVELAVAKALSRLPADRWNSAEEFSRALSDPRAISGYFEGFGAEGLEKVSPAAAWRALAPWLLPGAVALVLASSGLAWLLGGTTSPDPPPGPVTRFSVDVQDRVWGHHALALSPDGRIMAYTTRREGLVIRRMDQEEAVPVPRTTGAGYPFFSPDSRSIGFILGAEIWKVAATGGEPTLVARPTPQPGPGGATWRNDSTVVYSGSAGDLWEFSDRGGEASQVVALPGTGENAYLTWPHAFDDGRKLVYSVVGSGGLCAHSSVVVHDLERDERVTVMSEAGSGVYSPSGHILYSAANGSVFAVPFDPDRMEVTGPSFPLETGLWVSYWGCAAHYTVSEGGTFIFARGSDFENSLLFWIDRSGEELEQIGAPLTLEGPRLSPDGTRIATYLASPANADIYLIDVQTGDPRRITHHLRAVDNPVWSPDGRRLAYRVYGGAQNQSFEVMDIDGAGQPQVVYSSGQLWSRPSSWSPQGWLAFEEQHPERSRDILALRLDGSEEVLTVAGTEFLEYQARFSPHGDWIAYTSDETGQPEVYVVPFPELNRPRQISSDGGNFPRWSQTGNELFFYSSEGGGLFSTRYSTDNRVFRWETPEFLFPLGVTGVSPDAQRFLINRSNPDAFIKEIHVVENWFEVLRELEEGGG